MNIITLKPKDAIKTKQKKAKVIHHLIKTIKLSYKELTFKPYIKQKEIEGVHFKFLIGDVVGQDWYDSSCTDPFWTEMRFLKDKIIKPGDLIIECGGHHGCTAILLSNWTGKEGKVITFEGNPRNANILRKNIKLNNLDNVEIRAQAVGRKSGYAKFKISSDGRISFSNDFNIKISSIRQFLLVMYSKLFSTIEVPVVSLDDALPNMQPSLIKIDVEGFEVEVIKGATKIMSTHPNLAIEIHQNALPLYGSSVNELLELLHLEDYNCYVQLGDNQEVQPFTEKIDLTNYYSVHLFAVSKHKLRPRTLIKEIKEGCYE